MPDAAHGDDQRAIAELAAEMTDVHVEGAVEGTRLTREHRSDHRVARHDAACGLNEPCGDLVLDGRERERLAVDRHATGGGFERDAAGVKSGRR